MSSNQSVAEALSAQFEHHVKNYTAEGFASVVTDDVVMWHNFSNRELSGAELYTYLESAKPMFDAIEFSDKHILATAEGWVQQHRVATTVGDGIAVSRPVCVVFTVKDDKISRIDEYLDLSGLPNPVG